MSVTLVMTKHSAEWQEEEQREEQQVPAADQEHQRREQESVDGEAHQDTQADRRRTRADAARYASLAEERVKLLWG
jgi:hypothetical protein